MAAAADAGEEGVGADEGGAEDGRAVAEEADDVEEGDAEGVDEGVPAGHGRGWCAVEQRSDADDASGCGVRWTAGDGGGRG